MDWILRRAAAPSTLAAPARIRNERRCGRIGTVLRSCSSSLAMLSAAITAMRSTPRSCRRRADLAHRAIEERHGLEELRALVLPCRRPCSRGREAWMSSCDCALARRRCLPTRHCAPSAARRQRRARRRRVAALNRARRALRAWPAAAALIRQASGRSAHRVARRPAAP